MSFESAVIQGCSSEFIKLHDCVSRLHRGTGSNNADPKDGQQALADYRCSKSRHGMQVVSRAGCEWFTKRQTNKASRGRCVWLSFTWSLSAHVHCEPVATVFGGASNIVFRRKKYIDCVAKQRVPGEGNLSKCGGAAQKFHACSEAAVEGSRLVCVMQRIFGSAFT
jgi:hypothetical protein